MTLFRNVKEGANWENLPAALGAHIPRAQAQFGANLVVTVGGNGTDAGFISVGSANGSRVTLPPPIIPGLWVAGGRWANTLAYSVNGINWTGIGNTILDGVLGVGASPTMFIACGQDFGVSGNTLAYSYNGTNWTGLGKSIFSTQATNVAYGNGVWVATGRGGNTLAYSYDGINWTGLGTTVFGFQGEEAFWNGVLWVAAGFGNNPGDARLAYSYNGVNWTTCADDSLLDLGLAISYGNGLWVAGGGYGVNSLAHSLDGINWIGDGNAIMPACYGVRYASGVWVACGDGSAPQNNAMAYSYNGINWTGLGTTLFSFAHFAEYGAGIWVAAGYPSVSDTLAYSYDGVNWIGLGDTIFDTEGYNVAYRV